MPFFAIGLGLAAVTVWMEKHHVGASGSAWDLSAIDRVLVAGRAALVLRLHAGRGRSILVFFYPRWHVDAGAWWQYLFPAGAAAVLVGAVSGARRVIGRGPAAAVAFFVVTLTPALGFFDVYPMRYSFVADHFQYLASAGLLTLAAAAAATHAERVAAAMRPLAAVAGAVVLIALAALTWRQGRAYAGEETLWRTTIARNPQASMAHLNLGVLLAREGRVDAAIAEYRRTLAIDGEVADAHNDLGNALVTQGKVDDAIGEFRVALRLTPDDAPTEVNLANALATKGLFAEARAHYAAALRLRPGYADAHANLGTALAREGRAGEAVAELREAVRLDPGFLQARLNLAHLLADGGRAGEAAAEYREALRRRPDWQPALASLAWLLATSREPAVRDGAQAVELAARAHRAAGDDPATLDVLAAALAEAGRFEEARQVGARALQLAEQTGDRALAAEIGRRLRGYEAGEAYREG